MTSLEVNLILSWVLVGSGANFASDTDTARHNHLTPITQESHMSHTNIHKNHLKPFKKCFNITVRNLYHASTVPLTQKYYKSWKQTCIYFL